MTTVRELHDQAMMMAQDALVLRETGAGAEANSLASRALHLELQAASQIPNDSGSEPTRSILYRSAASLALQVGELDVVQRLVGEGLAGFPSASTRDELIALLKQAAFERRLLEQESLTRGAHLSIRIRGAAVGYGEIAYRHLRSRFDATIGLLDRTSRRLQGQPYQSSGPAPKNLQIFEPMVHAINPGSFEVDIELAHREESTMSMLTTSEVVIGSVIDGLNLVQVGDIARLREYIDDQAYLLNFCLSARELAPDGEDIETVEIAGADRLFEFTRRSPDISVPSLIAEQQVVTPVIRTVTGRLVSGNIRQSSNSIGIVTEDGGYQRLFVTEGLEDLVKTYFNMEVRAAITIENNKFTLVDLTPNPE